MKKQQITQDAESELDNCYNPNETLVKFILEWLQLHKKKEDETMKGAELSEEEKKKIRELSRMKVYVLRSILFPSMANLIYFFEALASSPRLSDAFHDEVEELLDPRRAKQAAEQSINDIRMSSLRFGRNNLARLVMAILVTHEKEGKPKLPITDFRLGLMYQLQNVIGDMMDRVLEYEYSSSQIWKSAIEDYGRMKGWVALLARSAEINNSEPDRKMGFCPCYWSSKASTLSLRF